jgi:hypothetical protein
MMQTLLHDEGALATFLLVNIVLGGGAAMLAGRAIAETWRPWWQVVIYMLMLGAAVRFIHFALFDAILLSLPAYLLDAAICLAFGLSGFRIARASQMVRQYRWIAEPDGPVRWRRKLP